MFGTRACHGPIIASKSSTGGSAEEVDGFLLLGSLHRGQREGWPVRAMVPPVTMWFILALVKSER